MDILTRVGFIGHPNRCSYIRIRPSRIFRVEKDFLVPRAKIQLSTRCGNICMKSVDNRFNND